MCDKSEANILWKFLGADPGTEDALVRRDDERDAHGPK